MGLTNIEIETMTIVKNTCRQINDYLNRKRKLMTFTNLGTLGEYVQKNNISVEDVKKLDDTEYVLIYT